MRVLLVIPLIIFVCIVVPRYNFACVIRRFCLHFCFGIVNWLVFFEMENFLPISFLFPFLFSPSCSPPIRPSNYSSSRSVHPMLHIASILSHSKRYNWWYLLNSDRMKVSAFAASSRLLQKIQQMKTEKLKKLVHASCALCFVVSLAVDLTYFRLLFINVSATTARGKKTIYETVGIQANVLLGFISLFYFLPNVFITLFRNFCETSYLVSLKPFIFSSPMPVIQSLFHAFLVFFFTFHEFNSTIVGI